MKMSDESVSSLVSKYFEVMLKTIKKKSTPHSELKEILEDAKHADSNLMYALYEEFSGNSGQRLASDIINQVELKI